MDKMVFYVGTFVRLGDFQLKLVLATGNGSRLYNPFVMNLSSFYLLRILVDAWSVSLLYLLYFPVTHPPT